MSHLETLLLIDPVAEQGDLQTALTTLTLAGVPTHKFHRTNINSMRIPVCYYLKQVKILTSIADPNLLTLIFASATEAGKMVSPQTLDEDGLLTVANWSKKGDGARSVIVAQQKLKADRKAARRKFVPKEPALAPLLEEQLKDLAAARKAERARREAEIERLENEIIAERLKLKRGLRIDKKYEPANMYKRPKKPQEINKLCYERYVKECKEKYWEAESWSPALAEKINSKWGDVVRVEHMEEFARRPENAEKLRAWGRINISGIRD